MQKFVGRKLAVIVFTGGTLSAHSALAYPWGYVTPPVVIAPPPPVVVVPTPLPPPPVAVMPPLPPPPPYEMVPLPRQGYVWEPGHRVWRPRGYVWRRGWWRPW